MYFWPFQSRRQLRSTIILMAGGLSIMGGIFYLTAPYALLNGLIGATIDGFGWGMYTVLPAHLTVTTRSEARYFLTDFEAMLAKVGYVASDQPVLPGSYHYRSKRSRFWRWDEQDIKLVLRNHEIVLTGPVIMLHHLRARLLPDPNAYLKA